MQQLTVMAWTHGQKTCLHTLSSYRFIFWYPLQQEVSWSVFHTQDHLLLPAGPLLLQHLAAGLCPPSEAAGAAAPAHLGHPPAGDLPEAAVGGAAAARTPGQPVSTHTGHTQRRAVRFAGRLGHLSAGIEEQISSSAGDWLVWLLPSSQQRWLDWGGDYVAAGRVRVTAGVGEEEITSGFR